MRCLWRRPPRVLPLTTWLLTALVTLMIAGSRYIYAQGKPTSASGDAQIAKAVGTIKSIQADSIAVTAESGGEGDIIAKLSSSTKILRVPPGEKDLKNATALQAQDLQTGDRVLVRGQTSANGDRHHHNFIQRNRHEPEYRRPHYEGHDPAPLCSRLGEVRRCETGARQPNHGAHQGGRST